MARTINIISRHIGKIRFKCKGEPRSVVFEDKGEVGVAVVDHDEAEVFLKVGKPDFWKEEGLELKGEVKTPGEKAPGKGEEEKVKKRNHLELIAEIKAAVTIEAVDALLVDEVRPSVLSAADIRKEELAEQKDPGVQE